MLQLGMSNCCSWVCVRANKWNFAYILLSSVSSEVRVSIITPVQGKPVFDASEYDFKAKEGFNYGQEIGVVQAQRTSERTYDSLPVVIFNM